MNLENYTNDRLWPILVDTAHQLVMFSHHKAYVRDSVLPESKQIDADKLASRLGISLGEALVIMFELETEHQKQA